MATKPKVKELTDDIFKLINKKKYGEKDVMAFCHAAIITYLKRNHKKANIVNFDNNMNLFYSIISEEAKEQMMSQMEMARKLKKEKSNPRDFNYIG